MEKSKTSSGRRKKKPAASVEGMSAAPISVYVLVKVHLWAGDGGNAPQLALAMVRDLLSASPCDVRDGSSSSVAASFQDMASAVNAARRLRQLVQGFSQASRAGHLGGCFILCDLEEAHPDVECALVQRFPVLTRGHSGQVLIVGSLCESIRSIPGLRFKAVSDEWMTPEVSRFYRSMLQLSPAVQMEGYVEEPTECWAPAVERKPQVVVADELVLPSVIAEVPAIEEITAISPAPAVAPDSPATTDQEIAAFSRMEKAAGRIFPWRWVAVGCAAVLVAAVAITIPLSRTTRHPVPQPVPVAPAPVPAVKTTVPSPPVSMPPQIPSAKSAKPSVREAAAAKLKEAEARGGQATDEGAGGTKKDGRGKPVITYSSDEINRLLASAERESGDGKYDNAIPKFTVILKVDPSNARAKDGLARARQNQASARAKERLARARQNQGHE